MDLGEIHQAAVTTTTGAALVVSGRGIRSLKRRHNKALGQIAKKRHRCQNGSRRDRRLQAARRKASARKRCQIRDLRHKGTRSVIAFCQQQGVGRLFIGDPHGVRTHRCGRHHNQRMSQWEYGKDIAYLTYKAKLPTSTSSCPAGYSEPVSSLWVETKSPRTGLALSPSWVHLR